MSIKTVAFLYPGAMGSSLARTLHTRQPQLTLLTSLSARSPATLERSSTSGLQNVPLPELVQRSDVIISILPPSAAMTSVHEILAVLSHRSSPNPPIYIDANAISPGTVSEISALLAPHQIPFIDAAVLGLPASETFDPKIYLSSAKAWDKQMREVVSAIGGGRDGNGLNIEVLEDGGEGAASALKMCYGGINKGYTGLASLIVLAAHAHSPGTADALLRELSLSKTSALETFSSSFPDMVGKAYRFVGEMREVSSFIHTSLSSFPDATSIDAKKVADTYEGLAEVFQRIANNVRQESATGQDASSQGEVATLLDFAKKGKQAVIELRGSRQ